jgi:beta-galactosidase
MNQKGYIFLLVFMAAVTVTQNSIALPGNKGINANRKADFDMGWRFHLGEVPAAKEINFADNSWRQLNLPHDWSIEGEFSKDNPAGVGGGALPGGIGWYRKTFTLPETDKNKSVFIDFDGVYMNSDVWINGHFLGNRPYGYSSFRYEMTP